MLWPVDANDHPCLGVCMDSANVEVGVSVGGTHLVEEFLLDLLRRLLRRPPILVNVPPIQTAGFPVFNRYSVPLTVLVVALKDIVEVTTVPS